MTSTVGKQTTDTPVFEYITSDNEQVNFWLTEYTTPIHGVALFIKKFYHTIFRTIIDPKSTSRLILQERVRGDDLWKNTNMRYPIRLNQFLSSIVASSIQLAKDELTKNELMKQVIPDYYRALLKELHHLQGNLYNTSYKRRVIKECMEVLYVS